MTRSRLLLGAFRVGGLLGLALLVMTKVPTTWDPVLARIVPGRLEYGDMYRETMIDRFKMRLPAEVGPALSRTESSLAPDFTVFVQGDSYAGFRNGHESFVASLSRRLRKPVYYEGWDVPDATCIFKRLPSPVDPKTPRVVVMQLVERHLIEKFEQPRPCPVWMIENHRSYRSLSALAQRLFDLTFSDNEKALRALFCYNVLLYPAMEKLFTLRFAATREIDASPVYSLNPPFLFTYTETTPGLTTSFYYPHDDALIARIADNIARVAKDLKEHENAQLVFVPVPDKYTVYHGLVNDDRYDDYLPRLADALDARGVRNVRLYERFRRSKELCYFPTDLHWNPHGLELAVDETVKAIQGPAPILARR